MSSLSLLSTSFLVVIFLTIIILNDIATGQLDIYVCVFVPLSLRWVVSNLIVLFPQVGFSLIFRARFAAITRQANTTEYMRATGMLSLLYI